MLTIYLALGIIAGGGGGGVPSDVVTPDERVIVLSRTTGFTSATHSIDPTDELDYIVDLSAFLETGETFDTVTIAVTPTSTALGFSIPGSGEFTAVEVDDSHIRIWPRIAPSEQSAAVWSGAGTQCQFEITAETDSAPTRTWQRTAQINVVQK